MAQTKGKNRLIKWVLVIAGLIIIQIIYYYPFQRLLCRKAWKEYMDLQGVSEEDIDTYSMEKIPKVNGWQVTAKYKSDPDSIYKYLFFLKSSNGTKMKIGRMLCMPQTNESKETHRYAYAALKETPAEPGEGVLLILINILVWAFLVFWIVRTVFQKKRRRS